VIAGQPWAIELPDTQNPATANAALETRSMLYSVNDFSFITIADSLPGKCE
jgi:hypothetical protein